MEYQIECQSICEKECQIEYKKICYLQFHIQYLLPARIVFRGGHYSEKVSVLNLTAAGIHSSATGQIQGNLRRTKFRLNPKVQMICSHSKCPACVGCCRKQSSSSLGCVLRGRAAKWKFAGAAEASETVMVIGSSALDQPQPSFLSFWRQWSWMAMERRAMWFLGPSRLEADHCILISCICCSHCSR